VTTASCSHCGRQAAVDTPSRPPATVGSGLRNSPNAADSNRPNRTRTKFPIFVKRRRSIVRFSMPCSLRRCPPMLRSCFGCYGRCLWKCRRRLHEIAEHAPTIGGKHYTPIYMEQLFASDAPASSAGIKECAAAVRAPVSRWVSITHPKLQSTHGPAQFSRRG
jgi:hypothetical protein